MKTRFLSLLAWAFYRMLTLSWRQRLVKSSDYSKDVKDGHPIIFAMWHGDELGAISFSRHFPLATLTSTSKDGEIMNGVLKRLGFATSRGSSTRGGVRALKGLIKLGKSGRVVVVPVDGPKGPRHKSKPGVFELSRVLGAKIYPIGIAASKKHIFERSWNKAYLPFPLSKVAMVVGDPLLPVTRGQDPKDAALANRLEKAIHGAGDQARGVIDTQNTE